LQRLHNPCRIRATPFTTLIAPVGHTPTHTPQPVQRSWSTDIIRLFAVCMTTSVCLLTTRGLRARFLLGPDDHNRHVTVDHHAMTHTTREQARQLPAATGAHHDQISPLAFRHPQDGFDRRPLEDFDVRVDTCLIQFLRRCRGALMGLLGRIRLTARSGRARPSSPRSPLAPPTAARGPAPRSPSLARGTDPPAARRGR
jgi:hypothetical protein